jgi:hypothetical protein
MPIRPSNVVLNSGMVNRYILKRNKNNSQHDHPCEDLKAMKAISICVAENVALISGGDRFRGSRGDAATDLFNRSLGY